MPSNKGAKRKAGGPALQAREGAAEASDSQPDVEAGAKVSLECNLAIKEFAKGARWVCGTVEQAKVGLLCSWLHEVGLRPSLLLAQAQG